MKESVIEAIVGFLVLLACVFFLRYGYKNGGFFNLSDSDGYTLSVTFNKVNGLNIGSDVRLGGIKIGRVLDEKLNQKTYQPVVTLFVQSNVRVPSDSSAKITSNGLLGNYYVSVTPGGSDTFLKNGDRILYTQGSVDLMSLIGQAVLGMAKPSSKKPSSQLEHPSLE